MTLILNLLSRYHLQRISLIALVLLFDWPLFSQVKSQKFIDRRVWTGAENIMPPKKDHKATIIFLHNIHNTGVSMRFWWKLVMPDSQFEHIKMIFPNGVRSYYAPLMGMERQVWYDQQGIGPEYPELRNDTYEIATQGLSSLIKKEIDRYNISSDKIVIGGFDQGGTMAMHVAFRYIKNLAGCFALTSYLCNDSILFEELPIVNNTGLNEPRFPPLFFVIGEEDPFIKLDWARDTFKRLEKCGVRGEFHIDTDVTYLYELRNWVIKKLAVD